MKVKKKLNVSADAYFDLLARYLLQDLRKTFGKKVKATDLKPGYTFTKTYKLVDESLYKSKQVLEEYDYGKAYRLTFTITQGTQIVAHTIKELGENQIEVTFEDTIVSSVPAQKFRNLTGANAKKKQMKQFLEQVEAQIIVK